MARSLHLCLDGLILFPMREALSAQFEFQVISVDNTRPLPLVKLFPLRSILLVSSFLNSSADGGASVDFTKNNQLNAEVFLDGRKCFIAALLKVTLTNYVESLF